MTAWELLRELHKLKVEKMHLPVKFYYSCGNGDGSDVEIEESVERVRVYDDRIMLED